MLALLFAAVLVCGGVRHAAAQSCSDPDTCSNNSGNGQSGAEGGAGGGSGGGRRGGGGGTSGSNTGNQSGTVGQSGGTGNGGASAGNGADGAPGTNVIADATPTPAFSSSASHASSSAPAPSAGSASADDTRLPGWANQMGTSVDEIVSWFGTISAADSIGGHAPPIVVHPGDQVTAFDGADGASDQGTTADGSSVQTGIQGVADSVTTRGGKVDVVLHSPAVALPSTTTSDGGRFSASVTIPASTTVGRHFIVALVPNTKHGRTAFVFPLTVTAKSDAAAVVDTQPRGTSKPFPWVLVEVILGTLAVVALLVVRVRRSAHSPSGAAGAG